jgi:tetratricopeptide (TPR) repeat protein
MLALETPLDAYRSDLARNRHGADFGGADTVWLLAAHCLSRLSRAAIEDRELIADQCASALRDFLDPHGIGVTALDQHERSLELVVDGFGSIMERSGADALARGIRGMATRMAESGALSTAYTTLAHAREVVVCACDRERGLLAADQAYIARLLGDLETAEELYQVASAIGERSTDFSLLARACIGRGVISRVRGNYPRARVFFERALELAETAKSNDLILLAHQGLTICFAIGKDFDRALQHGWSTFEYSRGDATREAESLSNLAQLCLDAGFPRAALQGFAAVLGRSDALRLCLGMLGGAAVAAARSGGSRRKPSDAFCTRRCPTRMRRRCIRWRSPSRPWASATAATPTCHARAGWRRRGASSSCSTPPKVRNSRARPPRRPPRASSPSLPAPSWRRSRPWTSATPRRY